MNSEVAEVARIGNRRLREGLIRRAVIVCAAMLLSSQADVMRANHATNEENDMQLSQEWDKTFPKSEKVDHQKVTFKNRYGITLAGDLYVPKLRASQRLAALAVVGPFGAVKEQSSGLYAQTMAERGYVALAFDPSYTGESGGEPRNVSSPDINTEDVSAARRLSRPAAVSGSQPHRPHRHLRLRRHGAECGGGRQADQSRCHDQHV
jgi:hypothetical protein